MYRLNTTSLWTRILRLNDRLQGTGVELMTRNNTIMRLFVLKHYIISIWDCTNNCRNIYHIWYNRVSGRVSHGLLFPVLSSFLTYTFYVSTDFTPQFLMTRRLGWLEANVTSLGILFFRKIRKVIFALEDLTACCKEQYPTFQPALEEAV